MNSPQKYKIAVLAGDGIGEEIMRQALKVLRAVEARNPIEFELLHGRFGATAWFTGGKSYPDETRALCDQADAILKGTIGLSHAESKQIPLDEQPERGALLPLRRQYDTFANFRPVYLPASLAHFSPLKPQVIGDGIDIMLIRELVGGLYFGDKHTGVNSQGLRFARETLEYDEAQIRRLVEMGFKTALQRRKKLHHIHKRNVLKSSVLWCDIVEEVAEDFPQVEVCHTLVDAAATHLCLQPTQFDVMVMENLFGDILSDQAGGIVGSLGLMPSACVGPGKAYYEPAHGSAPELAGKNIANPYAMLGSVAMMLEMSLGLPQEAKNLWHALQSVLASGYATPDLCNSALAAQPSSPVSTDEFGERVVAALNAAPY